MTESMSEELSLSNAYDDLNATLFSNNTVPMNCTYHMPIVEAFNQILYTIICVVGLLGNTLVIYVICRFSGMQTVTNVYILNLAIADDCFLIGIPFLLITMRNRTWPFGKFMCESYMISTSINQFTSSIFVFVMSADRYVAVCHPISQHKYRTPLISKIVSISAWIMSVIFMIPVFMYADLSAQGTCNIFWIDSHGDQTIFTIYSFVFSFALPLLLTFIFYTLVVQKLKTVGPKNKSKEKRRTHRKVTKLVLTVIAVYVICWLPYWCTQIALTYTPPNKCHSPITVTMFLLAGSLSYSNSAINPILYAFLSENFKKSFMKACTCATGADVNATLHAENSVLPRRKLFKTDHHQRGQSSKPAIVSSNSKINDDEKDENELGLLISKDSSTTLPMTSRSNVTISSENKSSVNQVNKDKCVKNGTQMTLLTQV